MVKQSTTWIAKPVIGDYCIILIGAVVSIILFQTLWQTSPATNIQIRQGKHVVGIYSLNQHRDIEVKGAIGHAHIQIANGKVRFTRAPCTNQYCVHQGWLTRAGQAAICLPNQLSVELLGAQKPIDTLSY